MAIHDSNTKDKIEQARDVILESLDILIMNCKRDNEEKRRVFESQGHNNILLDNGDDTKVLEIPLAAKNRLEIKSLIENSILIDKILAKKEELLMAGEDEPEDTPDSIQDILKSGTTSTRGTRGPKPRKPIKDK